jgi:hypothetical protein
MPAASAPLNSVRTQDVAGKIQMKVSRLIRLLQELPEETEVAVAPELASILRSGRRSPERQEDADDSRILRQRSRHPTFVYLQDVKRRYGVR